MYCCAWLVKDNVVARNKVDCLPQELAEVQQEGASVVQLLQQRQAGLAATLGQQFPEMRNTTWQSESSVQAAAQTLTPQMTENKKKVTTAGFCCPACMWLCAPKRHACSLDSTAHKQRVR